MAVLSNRINMSNVSFTATTPVGEFNRTQYGTNMTVGIEADFHWIMPLLPTQTRAGDGFVTGFNEDRFTAPNPLLTEAQLADARDNLRNNPLNRIVIEFNVPGLAYYPDLPI